MGELVSEVSIILFLTCEKKKIVSFTIIHPFNTEYVQDQNVYSFDSYLAV